MSNKDLTPSAILNYLASVWKHAVLHERIEPIEYFFIQSDCDLGHAHLTPTVLQYIIPAMKSS